MKRSKFLLSVALLLALGVLAGCASTPKHTLYWGDYSRTLYDFKHEGTQASMRRHVRELEDIIEYSVRWEKRVPPGVHAELGHFYAKQGKQEAAMDQFEKEMLLYPESKLLMVKVMERLQ